jgi:D-alanine-D-alanine ligase
MPDSRHYQDIKTVLPAPLTADELRDVEHACKAAYAVTGCRDYARIDLRIRDGLVYILDVNPNCDISPDTSTISAAEYAGYSYGEFGGHIVRMAEQRYNARSEQNNIELPLPRSHRHR